MRRSFAKLCLLLLAICCAVVFASLSSHAQLPSNGVPSNGTPSNGTPLNGTQSNGTPSNGTPSNGAPSNGVPSNTADIQVFENSLLFGNGAVFKDLTQHPLTAAYLTDPANPVYQFWSDSNSVLLMSYIWENAHSAGDNLVFCPAEQGSTPSTPVGQPCQTPANQTFVFYGGLGVCDYSAANEMALPTPPAGQRGWAIDEPLINPVGPSEDVQCQHWESALLLSESNNFHVHNLYSAIGPSSDQGPGFIGNQLTKRRRCGPGISVLFRHRDAGTVGYRGLHICHGHDGPGELRMERRLCRRLHTFRYLPSADARQHQSS